MKRYCNMTWKEVVDLLEGNIYRGLKDSECAIRKKRYGDNKIILPKGNSLIKSIFKSIFKLYMLISIAIFGTAIYFKEISLASIIGIMIIINLILKILILFLNRKKLMYLQKLNKSTVKVLRNNNEEIISSDELVKGDIVLLSKGSLVGADLRIIEAKDIKVDEKNITGETFLKEKFESKIDGNIDNLGDMNNILFKGSVIKDGIGVGIVVELGGKTQLGKLMSLIAYADNNKHIVGEKIEKKVSKTSIVLVLITLISMLLIGNSIHNIILALTLIASIPIAPVIFSYIYLLKKDLKEKENIELINISTLDLINDLEYVFLDKIGSITKNEMVVQDIYTNDKIYKDDEINYHSDVNIKRIMDIVLLCNDAVYNVTEDSGVGNIFEIAYLRYAAEHRIYKSMVDSKCHRVVQIPMDSDKRILTTVNKYKKGYRANVRGDLDSLLERCTHIMVDGIEKEITEEDITKIKGIDYNFSVAGLISQAVAYRSFSYQPSLSENIESNLVFVGIIALENPLNENIKEELLEIKNRGLNPIIFTQDNRIAAVDLGKKTNLINDIGGVISGVEMESLGKEEVKKVLSKVRIFSRITPELKGKIVGLFARDKYNVATTGETLGELPSLTLAKVGIGKGNVPEIVKKVSDVYIKENFLTGFLKLFDISKTFNIGINKLQKFICTLLLSEIITINLFHILNKDTGLDLLIILNLILIIPLSLILLNKNTYSNNDINKFIIRGILWTGIPSSLVFIMSSGYNTILYITLGIMIIIFTFSDSRIILKSIDRELFLFILSILLLIALISYAIISSNLQLEREEIIIMLSIIIGYLIIELIMRKWK